MIRVKLTRDAPAHLSTPGAGGMRERDQALAFYQDPANLDQPFKGFKAYSDRSVKDALHAMFRGKCAYCETRYAASQPADVEHYRPKGEVTINGRARRPGYYWLAATWGNLLPSCIDCNRSRNQPLVEGGEAALGKANQFPIANESCRDHPSKMAPGLERKERALLLNPYRHDPGKHLDFLDNGRVAPAPDRHGQPSKMGEASIEVYALQRLDLVLERESRLLTVKMAAVQVVRLTKLMDLAPSPELDEILTAQVRELKRLIGVEQPYTTAARQVVRRILPELEL